MSSRVMGIVAMALSIGLLGSAPSCRVEHPIHVENRTNLVLQVTTEEVLDNLNEPTATREGKDMTSSLNPGHVGVLAEPFLSDCLEYRIVAWRYLRDDDGEFIGREVIEILEAGDYCAGEVWVIDGDPTPTP